MPAIPTPTSVQEMDLRNTCSAWLNGHRPHRSMRDALQSLASAPEAQGALDLYGEGALTQELEARVAALLGKPAALFFHKGVAAQLAALKVWVGDRPNARVALHRRSHIEWDEAQAYEEVLGLRGQRLGVGDTIFTAADLGKLPERPAAVTVELPLRLAGYLLPTWDEWVAIGTWCREREVPLHLDGARLWESAPYYGRPLAEIAAVADSVYVSFYKGLGGLGGAMLAGPESFIASARAWKTRLAGNLYTAFPYVLSAATGLQRHLERMPAYHARAKQLAAALETIDGAVVRPRPPQTNAFQLHLAGTPATMREAMLDVARTEGFWLGARAQPSALPGKTMVEVFIGDAADDWADDQVVRLFRQVAQRAASDAAGAA
jgi:threonine aldolase